MIAVGTQKLLVALGTVLLLLPVSGAAMMIREFPLMMLILINVGLNIGAVLFTIGVSDPEGLTKANIRRTCDLFGGTLLAIAAFFGGFSLMLERMTSFEAHSLALFSTCAGGVAVWRLGPLLTSSILDRYHRSRIFDAEMMWWFQLVRVLTLVLGAFSVPATVGFFACCAWGMFEGVFSTRLHGVCACLPFLQALVLVFITSFEVQNGWHGFESTALSPQNAPTT